MIWKCFLQKKALLQLVPLIQSAVDELILEMRNDCGRNVEVKTYVIVYDERVSLLCSLTDSYSMRVVALTLFGVSIAKNESEYRQFVNHAQEAFNEMASMRSMTVRTLCCTVHCRLSCWIRYNRFTGTVSTESKQTPRSADDELALRHVSIAVTCASMCHNGILKRGQRSLAVHCRLRAAYYLCGET